MYHHQPAYCDKIDVDVSLSTSLVEGDILNCIVEFPRYALLHVEAALFLYE
jgi:hypothetical protein